LANLEVLINGKYVERAASLGDFLETRLHAIAARYQPFVGAVHGKGMVYGLHIVEPGTERPNGAVAFDIVRRCFESGLLMFAPVGLAGATVKISPPLVTPEEALEEGLDVLEGAFASACGATDRRRAEAGA
jgi:4-aminobutyrate aminotransferase-like enzyme